MIYVLIHYTKSWQPLADIVVPNADEYCKRHGYTLDVRRINDYQIYTGLEKLRHTQEVVGNGDVAMVMDCDSLITNHKVTVGQFINGLDELYVCEGMNMGIFIVCKWPWSDNLVGWMIDDIEKGEYLCEQDAISHYIKTIKNINVVNHPAFNSYMSELYPEVPQPVTEEQGQWVAGKSFVLHLPGLGMEKRLEILKSTPITK